MRIENLIKLTKRKKQGRIYRGLRGLQPPYSHETPLEQEVDGRGEGRRKKKKKSGK